MANLMIHIRPLNELHHYLVRLTKNRLWLRVIFAIVLGAGLGLLLNPSAGYLEEKTTDLVAEWLQLPGSIFMRLVQMIMVPLIFTSILTGIVSNNSNQLRKMGVQLLGYFLFTTTVAIFIGSVITLFFEPGVYIHDLGGFAGGSEIPENIGFNERSIPTAISELIPNNPLEAMLTGEMLGVVIFTVIIAIAITQLKEDLARPIVRFSEAIQKICMIVVSWAMLLIPYAVFGMVAALIATLGINAIYGLGFYMLVVIGGLLLLMIFYLLVVTFVGKQNPLTFLRAVRDPQLLAFATASSAAVMPLSMEVADKKLGVSSSISDLVIPVGATVNMDGTALFQCVTTIFMAQAYGIDLGITTIILMTFTIVGASIGTPAIPGGGVIILASVLGSAGIPVEGLVTVIGVDRVLGMFRTALNVTGDLTACVVFNRWFGEKKDDTHATSIN